MAAQLVDREVSELVIDARPAPGDSSDGGGTAMGPIAVPVLVAGALAKFISPTAGLVALGAGAALWIARWKPNRGRFVLRVIEDTIEIARERGKDPPLRVPIADVLDVTLERKTSQTNGRVTERLRLALERKTPEETIYVPDSPLTPIEAQEWLGKVRVFLRKHEWLPKDERA